MVQSDAEIVSAVLSGYKGAFAALVKRYERPVRAIAMNVLGDYHSIADVSQDAFVKAYRELPGLQLFNAPTCDLHPSQFHPSESYGEWTLKRRSTAILAVSLWLGHPGRVFTPQDALRRGWKPVPHFGRN